MVLLRRDFLVGLSGVVGGVMLGQLFQHWPESFPLAGDEYIIMSAGKSAYAINLKNHSVVDVPIDFIAHSYVQDPHQPHIVWGIEKWGRVAAQIDLQKRAVLHSVQTPETFIYGGHGVFSPDGDMIYMTGSAYQKGGYLLGYAPGDRTPSVSIRLAATTVHEGRLLADRNTILTTSHGLYPVNDPAKQDIAGIEKEISGFIPFDLRQQRVLEKIALSDKDQFLGHYTITQDGTIIGVCMGQPTTVSQIYIGKLGSPPLEKVALPPHIEKNLRGENLSIAVDEENHVVVVTNPSSNLVIAANTQTRKYIGSLNLNKPTSIIFEPHIKKFICGSKEDLVVFDHNLEEKSYLPVRQAAMPKALNKFNGRHSILIRMPKNA